MDHGKMIMKKNKMLISIIRLLLFCLAVSYIVVTGVFLCVAVQHIGPPCRARLSRDGRPPLRRAPRRRRDHFLLFRHKITKERKLVL